MSKQAREVLSRDKKLAKVIAEIGELKLSANYNLYESLIRSIVSQQLSVKAADTIHTRFLNLFPDKSPKAEHVLKIDVEKLRGAGLSYQKAGYIKNIAQFSIEKTMDYKKLVKYSDEELIEYLTEIKGVGKWTTEMILMFSLKRENIFPIDDLGIQQAIKKLYKIDAEGKELKAKMLKIAEKWHPYRTYASMYLWRWKDSAKKVVGSK